jgi:hypothetical protein
LAWITPRLREFSHNILKSRKPYLGSDIGIEPDGSTLSRITEEILNAATDSCGHAIYEFITLWMNGTGIERMSSTTNTEKACRLFKGLGPETADTEELLA